MINEIKGHELIRITATSADCSQESVQRIIDAYLDTIMRELRIRDRVELRTDFGSFVIREKGSGTIPPGQRCAKSQKVVSFKATPTLKKSLRESDLNYLARLQSDGADLQIEHLREESEHK